MSQLPLPWSESNRLVPRAFVRPLRRFASTEASSGVAMLLMAVVALVWANSAAGDSYVTFWETAASIHVGDLIHLDLSVREWVNDLFMGVFFFVVALEIKRELVRGELRDPRSAALPAIAALGGMIVPALIYASLNSSGEGSGGWGIPMATDIAFAVGVVSLLGRRVPSSLVVFLLTLAIVDDLGAILVIAIFYTSSLSFAWLGAAVSSVALAAVLRRQDFRSLVPYTILAGFCWYALHESGVHATLAGVAFGLLTPSRSFYDRPVFSARAGALLSEYDASRSAGETEEDHEDEDSDVLEQLIDAAVEVQPPLDRLEHRLLPWTSFVIVPIFALANAGVRFSFGDLADAFGDSVTLGAFAGLLLGKPVGVFLATWVAVRLGVGRMPVGASWRQVFGIGILAGIGFTVALFVTELAFDVHELADAAKIGILSASTVAGLVGYAFLRSVTREPLVLEKAGAASD